MSPDDFVPVEFIEKIIRNLKRCAMHPDRSIPATIFRRDIDLLVSDICTRVYGDLIESFIGLKDLTGLDTEPNKLQASIVKQATKAVVPHYLEVWALMRMASYLPAYKYELEIRKLLVIRSEAINTPDLRKFTVARVFFSTLSGELHRVGSN